ncbi:MAG: universal stress protein [Thermoleophilia bacterium]
MAGFGNVLVCSDFSENSNKAFEAAVGLCEGKLVVLHVVATSYNYDVGEMQDKSASTVAKVYGEKAEARMRELYGKADVEVVVEYGNEAEKILEVAHDRGADVIVMGARGVGFMAGLLGGGSVVNKVVKSATVPVLVVPA